MAEHFHQHFGDKVLGMSLTPELPNSKPEMSLGAYRYCVPEIHFRNAKDTSSTLAPWELGILSLIGRLGWQHLKNQLPGNGLPHVIN